MYVEGQLTPSAIDWPFAATFLVRVEGNYLPGNTRPTTDLPSLFRLLPRSRSRLATTEAERDRAVAAVQQLSDRTDSLEEQLDKLGRLLEEARERVSEKAQQLHITRRGTYVSVS